VAVVTRLTVDELAAHAKGFGKRFDDYVDINEPIRITLAEYAKIVDWCEPYMRSRHEVQGAVTFHFEGAGPDEWTRLVIERAYVMGGNSHSFRSTCLLDGDDMLRQMQVDYPQRTAFMSDQVGWWHLHPAYYPALSVGDVEECRQVMRDSSASDTKILQLLMYGDGRGYQLSGYLVGMDEVNRLPVRIVNHPSDVDLSPGTPVEA
jgi:hypothetical protein